MKITDKAFILTAQHTDFTKNQIHLFAKNEEGILYELVFDNKPVLFIDRQTNDEDLSGIDGIIDRKSVPLKSFQFKDVDALYFQKQDQLFKAKPILKSKLIRTYESDIRPHERFLMERFISGGIAFSGEFEQKGNIRVLYNPQIKKEVNVRLNYSIISFDIETSGGNELYSIAYHFKDSDRELKKVLMIGPVNESTEDLVFFNDEKTLIQSFFSDFLKLDPDFIIGWHVIGFDFDFILRKCSQYKIPTNLGRMGGKLFIEEREGVGWFARLKGRVVLDGPSTLKSNFFSFTNYKLETVANEVLGTGKEIDKSAGKLEEIQRMFKEDKRALAKYNIIDCVLVTRIFEHFNLVHMLIERVKVSGLLFDRLGVSTKAFDHLFLPKLHRNGFVAPDVMDVEQGEQSTGGYVISPDAGIYDNVLLLDFKSLYPTIIQTFKIDPLSRLFGENDDEKNTLTTPSGHKMSRDQNLLPEIISELLQSRSKAKADKNDALSYAIKILMNSLYGVMGSYGCRFYHHDLPTSITKTGHFLILETKKLIEEKFGHEVIYGDTDSVFVQTKVALNDSQVKDMVSQINAYWTERIQEEWGLKSHLELEFESSFSTFILPLARNQEGGAKKRYAAYAQTQQEPILFKGMEFVRSDWTAVSKRFQYGLYEHIFQKQNVEEFIKTFLNDLKGGIFDEELVYEKRLRKKASEYVKSTPPHVKAARLAGVEKGNIQYVMTVRGPIPLSLEHSDIDYTHYIEKQVQPIADSVLPLVGLNFESLTQGSQLTLFEM